MPTISIENFRAAGASANAAKFSLIASLAEFLSAEDIQMDASTLRELLLTNGIGPFASSSNPVKRPTGINDLLHSAQMYYLVHRHNPNIAGKIRDSFYIDEDDEFDD